MAECKINSEITGKAWHDCDNKKVKELVHQGKQCSEIAKIMNRSELAIYRRYKQYAREDIMSGKDKTEILKMYGLSRKEYDKYDCSKKGSEENKDNGKAEIASLHKKIDAMMELLNQVIKTQNKHSVKLESINEYCS